MTGEQVGPYSYFVSLYIQFLKFCSLPSVCFFFSFYFYNFTWEVVWERERDSIYQFTLQGIQKLGTGNSSRFLTWEKWAELLKLSPLPPTRVHINKTLETETRYSNRGSGYLESCLYCKAKCLSLPPTSMKTKGNIELSYHFYGQ